MPRFIGRRTLIASGAIATVSVVSGCASQSPSDKAAIDKAYTDGVAAGRQALIKELKQVNGVSFSDALTSATTTKNATQVIAQPMASVLTAIGDKAISFLISALGDAKNSLNALLFFGDAVAALDKVQQFFRALQDNVNQLGESLAALPTDTKIEFAEEFLNALVDAIPELAE